MRTSTMNPITYWVTPTAKMGNWQQALNNYLEAIERNPESPAVSARDMIMNILNFYNKDMYNQ